MAIIPEYIESVEQNIDVFKVKNPKEFIFGMIIGVTLGLSSIALSTKEDSSEIDSVEEQQKLKD